MCFGCVSTPGHSGKPLVNLFPAEPRLYTNCREAESRAGGPTSVLPLPLICSRGRESAPRWVCWTGLRKPAAECLHAAKRVLLAGPEVCTNPTCRDGRVCTRVECLPASDHRTPLTSDALNVAPHRICSPMPRERSELGAIALDPPLGGATKMRWTYPSL